MRSNQVYRASDKVANRFALCGTASRSVRIIHKQGTSIGESVTSALEGISGKGFRIFPDPPALPALRR